MQNLNNQLIGKDKYITVVPNDRLYLIEDYTDLNGCFVFATKNTTYSLTEQISQDYYSFQNYQGNNYIKFADGFPINDYVTFKIIRPEELLSLPFKFSTISSITPDALNKNFDELKRVCLLLQEITNNRTMRLDTTDGQVMLPELQPLQTWLKDVTGNYKAISLDDFKELGESLILDYYNYIQQLMNTTFNNARDSITTVKSASILEMQNFLKNFLAETTAFTESQKAVLQKIVDDFKIFVNTTEIGNAKLLGGFSSDEFLKTENSLETLKKSTKYKLGDVVKVLGAVSVADGLQHLRIISDTNTNNGVQTASGLWANLIPNSQDSEKQDKVDNRLTTTSKNVVEAINSCYSPTNKPILSEIGAMSTNECVPIFNGTWGDFKSKTNAGVYTIIPEIHSLLGLRGYKYGTLTVDYGNYVSTKQQVKLIYTSDHGEMMFFKNWNFAMQSNGNETFDSSQWVDIFNSDNCPSKFQYNSGWQKLASGLIIQYGYFVRNNANGQTLVTFPISFSNYFSTSFCDICGTIVNNVNVVSYDQYNQTQMTVKHAVGDIGVMWIAVGV